LCGTKANCWCSWLKIWVAPSRRPWRASVGRARLRERSVIRSCHSRHRWCKRCRARPLAKSCRWRHWGSHTSGKSSCWRHGDAEASWSTSEGRCWRLWGTHTRSSKGCCWCLWGTHTGRSKGCCWRHWGTHTRLSKGRGRRPGHARKCGRCARATKCSCGCARNAVGWTAKGITRRPRNRPSRSKVCRRPRDRRASQGGHWRPGHPWHGCGAASCLRHWNPTVG